MDRLFFINLLEILTIQIITNLNERFYGFSPNSGSNLKKLQIGYDIRFVCTSQPYIRECDLKFSFNPYMGVKQSLPPTTVHFLK